MNPRNASVESNALPASAGGTSRSASSSSTSAARGAEKGDRNGNAQRQRLPSARPLKTSAVNIVRHSSRTAPSATTNPIAPNRWSASGSPSTSTTSSTAPSTRRSNNAV